MNKLIAFSGPMGSGKSTAVQYLVDRIENIKLIKFAGPLYDMQEFIYRRVEKVYKLPAGFIKDRQLLQWLGTEWGRSRNPEMWVKLFENDVVGTLSQGNPVICDDLRFNNEAIIVKQLGGAIIKLRTNKNHERIDTSLSAHASETGIDDKYADFIIDNNGTLEDYEYKLKEVFSMMQLNKI